MESGLDAQCGDDQPLGTAIDEFFLGYFSTHARAGKTVNAYRCDLKQFELFAKPITPLSNVRSETIEQWSSHLKTKKYSPASVRRKMVALRVFISYWMRKGVIVESPFWRVKLSYGRIEQLPRSLTRPEMQKLLATAREQLMISREADLGSQGFVCRSAAYRSLRNLAIIELLFATGLRVGELSALDKSDYVADENAFLVHGKGNVHRLAFLVDRLAVTALQNYLQLRSTLNLEASALFLNHRGQRLSTQGIANVLTEIRKRANVGRHVTPHMLRHTVATLLLRNGVDIRVVQEFLGHASIATTQRYTHVSKEHMVSVLRSNHPSLAFRSYLQPTLALSS
jgi:integrase/recombinase XerD